jgi:hypothetical protein
VSVADCGWDSGDATSDLWVAFWAATMLRGRTPPLELGRLCHDNGEALSDDVDMVVDLRSTLPGVSFSLVGELEAMASRDNSGSAESSRVPAGAAPGDSSFNASERWTER